MCIQPRTATGGTVGVGVQVWLSFYSGLFTAPPVQTSTAIAGSTTLSTTPTSIPTAASCLNQNGTDVRRLSCSDVHHADGVDSPAWS